jgi:hypothetical protein
MTFPRPPRWFIADDILAGRVSLDGYPFRYIYVSVAPSFAAAFAGAALADAVMTAAEFLETRGWQVVNFEQGGQIAYLRRL